jgi:RNA polymerase-binding transcription factor DksA
MIGRHVDELRDIEAARERMADGTYGRCVDCGEDIDVERLRAYPTARRCVRDQRRVEQSKPGSTPSL